MRVRFLLPGVLLVTNTLAKAQAPATGAVSAFRVVERAWPPIPAPLYYLDGQRLDSVGAINPADIASINLLKGAAAEAFTPEARGRGIAFITSKRQRTQPAVRALNQRVRQLQQQYSSYPATPATSQGPATLQPAGVYYYLNGQPTSRAAVDTISGRRVRSFRTLRGPRAAAYAHDPKGTEVFLVETRP